jgi:hypothetical protein
MAIIFAVLLPQLRTIQNSWNTQAGASETLQNARVLTEHLHRNLSKAARITAVSDSSTTSGYIEFIDNDANSFRYDVNSTSNYVEFGLVGSLSDLAGPVSQLQFACYDALDLDTPITDVNSIRNVKVTTTLANSANLDQDMTFTTQAYIRANTLPATGISKMSDPWLEFDAVQGWDPALAHMSGTKYLCAYRGDRDDGYACILTVDPADWSVSAASFLEYDIRNGQTPALAKIDDMYFLCAYQGNKGNGYACILFEKIPATLQRSPSFTFDATDCVTPALSKIATQGNDHYFLCTYAAPYEVRVVVLTATVTQVSTDIQSGPIISFPASSSPAPGLARIDDTHYLCAYEGETGSVHGGAVVLSVNPADWTVTTETHFDFFGETADAQMLAKIDDTHYFSFYLDYSLCARATVLTVDPADWSITKKPGPDFLVEPNSSSHQICPIDNTDFLCVYRVLGTEGTAAVLTVDTGDWAISKKTPLAFEPGYFMAPALCQIDAAHYLCAYPGPSSHGLAGVLELSTGIRP